MLKGGVINMSGQMKNRQGMSTFGSMIATLVTMIVLFGIIEVLTAEPQKCSQYGCDNECESGSDYCSYHDPSSYSRYSNNQKTSNSNDYSSTSNYSSMSSDSYEESDTCHHGSCEKKVISGSRYCSSHTCGKGRNGCYREVPGANELCSSCREKQKNTSSVSTSSTRSSTYNTKKNTSSEKNYEMPDCDDYESYDDFMDDWDGNMPDGSDAEDYWEDW